MISAIQGITQAHCPHCKTELFIPEANRSYVFCSSCHSKYLATQGILNDSDWHTVEDSNAGRTKRVYDLRLDVHHVPQRQQFSMPAHKEILSLMPNDQLLFLHVQNLERLALVQNLDHHWAVPFIDNKITHLGKMIGLAIGLIFLGGYGATVFSTSKYAPLVGLSLTMPITVFALNRMRKLDFIETDEQKIFQLSRDQRLLKQKRLLLGKIAELEQKKKSSLAISNLLMNCTANSRTSLEVEVRIIKPPS
jgi:hypothetical protein